MSNILIVKKDLEVIQMCNDKLKEINNLPAFVFIQPYIQNRFYYYLSIAERLIKQYTAEK